MNEFDDRFVQLETKLLYLEDFIEKLQNVTVEHTKMLTTLVSENNNLQCKIAELIDLQQEIPNTKPPHY